jgi:hypothetical protein
MTGRTLLEVASRLKALAKQISQRFAAHNFVPGPSDTIGNHVESYVRFKSLKDSIGVEIFRWDG